MIDPHRHLVLQDALDCCDSPAPHIWPESPNKRTISDPERFLDALADSDTTNITPESADALKSSYASSTFRYYSGYCDTCNESFKRILADDLSNDGHYRLYCTECVGTGIIYNGPFDPSDCRDCNGSGWRHHQWLVRVKRRLACSECGGTGEQIVMWDLEHDYDCPQCNGRKWTLSSLLGRD